MHIHDTRKHEIKECREVIEYESNQMCVKLKRMKCNSESYFWDNVRSFSSAISERTSNNNISL